MTERTLEDRLSWWTEKGEKARASIDRANELRERAREMGGGLLSFGGSGPQRARASVQSATERGLRALNDAQAELADAEYKVREYKRRIAERDRTRFTREDLVGATHVRLSGGWWKVAKVNRTTVSVETGYSWTDRHEFSKVLEVKR